MQAEQQSEREAYVSWLSGTYPHAWSRESAEHNWRHDHVSVLAWKARAALSHPSPQWLPIESAPTTGRQIILLLTPSRWPQIAYSNTWWTSGFSVENKPTHWMPLPPPTPEQGSKG